MVEIKNTFEVDSKTVCKGKLILVYQDRIIPTVGMIGSNNVHPLFMWTEAHQGTKLVEYKNTQTVLPIIISETEQLLEGDQMYSKISKTINTCNNPEIAKGLEYVKIIVLPLQFSEENLKNIIDGKLKNGDELLVECEENKIKYNITTIFPIPEPSWRDIIKDVVTNKNKDMPNTIGTALEYLSKNYDPPKRK